MIITAADNALLFSGRAVLMVVLMAGVFAPNLSSSLDPPSLDPCRRHCSGKVFKAFRFFSPFGRGKRGEGRVGEEEESSSSLTFERKQQREVTAFD